ncbi:MAG: ribonuclease [Burkholderiaceae bacterium]|nr:MAG: ribonuclease N1 [Burkholderiaceae bacterium]MBE7425734.1 ribonuclease N1 [Ideonella sp.]MCC7287629.1 ribonuclease [Burkholderiaceae bacterium]
MDWTVRSLLSGSLFKLGLATAVAISSALVGTVQAKGPVTASEPVALAELPREAQQTQRLVRAGGPFPYVKDGATFGNRERQLPRRSRGYYREYTVPTPGASNRGARRIVCGGVTARQPEVCYYTDDHYASFRRIAQ